MIRTAYDEFQSNTTEDAMGLEGNAGKTTCMIKEIENREWVNNT
jgi:hypothetical protein